MTSPKRMYIRIGMIEYPIESLEEYELLKSWHSDLMSNPNIIKKKFWTVDKFTLAYRDRNFIDDRRDICIMYQTTDENVIKQLEQVEDHKLVEQVKKIHDTDKNLITRALICCY